MPLRLGDPLPSLDGATRWYNGDMSSALTGDAPVLVHFWSVSCYLCKNNFAAVHRWREQYASRGLKVIAIHMPRQEEDTDVAAVERVMAEHSITEPCAIDNDHLLKDAFKNDQAWVPAYFLFDREGNLRGRSAGEAGISMLQSALDRMFPEDLQAAAGA